ncbi:DnaA regulatory inactivator Hda [Aquimonas voraii]|uniref:Regulatory inactivation of DnaA Hda protein n=1 Tax=Aquimonas voraii TaxID=265719 RepID=A0A1G6S2S3_9GAMM|nr:DnaA regulatory inactivator Hda [Aquimonas voraii]SDD10485.1 regulatory inactivation of DnaA Hda protein [Aquimonas voraii]
MSVPQLPLNLRAPQVAGFEDFEGSVEAVALLRACARGEASGHVFLDGPPGSGRSHLLLSTVAEARRAGREVQYLPLAVLGERAVDALQAVEGTGLIALDDLQAVVGEREREVALFALHNRAHDRGGQLVYAADASPQGLPLVLPDLRSRLQQCSRFSLGALDDEARRRVLKHRAHARGLELDEPVLDYLFRRHSRDLQTLTRLLDRLDRESLAAQRRITVPFLRTLLGLGA